MQQAINTTQVNKGDKSTQGNVSFESLLEGRRSGEEEKDSTPS